MKPIYVSINPHYRVLSKPCYSEAEPILYALDRYGSDCLGGCTCVMNQTSTCNAINGACFCLSGFHGVSCEKTCNQGYYGDGCKQQCSCLHGANCDPVRKKAYFTRMK